MASELGLIPGATLPASELLPRFIADAVTYEIFLRMAFSALVDTDHGDVETVWLRVGRVSLAMLHPLC